MSLERRVEPAVPLAAATTEAGRDAHRVRLARLQDVTSALSRASTPAEVAGVAVRIAAAVVEAKASMLWLLDDDGTLRLAAAHGTDAAVEAEWAHIGADVDVPMTRALRSLEPLWISGEDDYAALDPTMAERARARGRSTAFAALPLTLEDRSLGVLSFAFGQRHVFSDDEKSFILTLAQQCAQAVDRSRLLEAERTASGRLAVLARAGELLTQTLDFDATLLAVTRAAVPAFADWASVDLVDRGSLKRVAISHRDPAKVTLGAEIARRFPERLDGDTAVPQAIRTGRGVLIRRVDEAAIAAAIDDPAYVEILLALGLSSVMVVPIFASGRTLGALSLVTTRDSGRIYGDRDLELALELARRTGAALANTQLFAREQAASRRAEDANRIKDEFLATVSHELRTPLNAILGWSSLLLGPKAGDPAAAAKGLEVIRRNAQAQAKLVEDILDVSRIITGKLKIDPIPVDLTAIAREAMEVVRPGVDAKGVALELDPNAEPVLLVGDPARLQQVVWNLLSNAVKFTDHGGLIQVAVVREGTQAKLVVSDTGRGISGDFLPHVFERFRQGDSSTTRAFGGLGLGLAIVRHIVELHGGQVRALSAGSGFGSTFSVTLPIRAIALGGATSSPAPANPQDRVGSDRVSPLIGVRVLIVDDEPDARELIANVLESAGAEVRAVGSVGEAMRELGADPPDVLLSDIGMPDADGYALIRAARELSGPELPAIALTAYARAEDRARALAAGFDLHLPKPVEPNDLVRAIARVCRR